jgi:hypothetical protein
MLVKLRNTFFVPNRHPSEVYRRIIRQEATIGGRLFGPLASGSRREFFCLDEHTWVWHEEWQDEAGQIHMVMTRYDVRSDGVYKAQDRQPYQYIHPTEARRLYKAIAAYNQAVDGQLRP